MIEYRIVTKNSKTYPYVIQVRFDGFLGKLNGFIDFTKYSTLEEAREKKLRFIEHAESDKIFKSIIIE